MVSKLDFPCKECEFTPSYMRLLPDRLSAPAAVEEAMSRFLSHLEDEGTDWNVDYWTTAISVLRRGKLINVLPTSVSRSFLTEYLGGRFAELPKTTRGLTDWSAGESVIWATDCFLLSRIWGDAPYDPSAERLSNESLQAFAIPKNRSNFIRILSALESEGMHEAFRLAESYRIDTGVPFLGPAYMTKCWYVAAESWGAHPPLVMDRHVINFFRSTQLLAVPKIAAWRRPNIEYLSFDEYLRYNAAMYQWANRLGVLAPELEFCVFENGRKLPIPPEDFPYGGERG